MEKIKSMSNTKTIVKRNSFDMETRSVLGKRTRIDVEAPAAMGKPAWWMSCMDDEGAVWAWVGTHSALMNALPDRPRTLTEFCELCAAGMPSVWATAAAVRAALLRVYACVTVPHALRRSRLWEEGLHAVHPALEDSSTEVKDAHMQTLVTFACLDDETTRAWECVWMAQATTTVATLEATPCATWAGWGDLKGVQRFTRLDPRCARPFEPQPPFEPQWRTRASSAELYDEVLATIKAAASAGHLHVLKWMVLDDECDLHTLYMRRGENSVMKAVTVAAARGGHLHVLQWAVEEEWPQLFLRDPSLDPPLIGLVPWARAAWQKVVDAAAEGGHLHIMQWIRKQPNTIFKASTCASAAAGGHLHVLRWLRDDSVDCSWHAGTCDAAVRGGHYHVLQYALEHGCPSAARFHHPLCTAARRGDLRALQMLRPKVETEYRMMWDDQHGVHIIWTSVVGLAAQGGHLHILQYLATEGLLLFPPSQQNGVLTEATQHGSLPCVRFLHANGISWEATTCAAAVEYGHLHVLQWLVAHGAPFHAQALHDTAMQYAWHDIAAWIRHTFLDDAVTRRGNTEAASSCVHLK